MSVQIGAALLVKMRPSADQPFETVAGLRARSIALTASPIDATHGQSPARWRQLLGHSGVRQLRLQGDGVFANSPADMAVNHLFFSGDHAQCQITIPSFGTLTGAFAVVELVYIGHDQGEMLWRIALHSADEVHFVDA